MAALWGALEAGGTKFVCAVGTGPNDLRDEVRFATKKPEETLASALAYFQTAERKYGKLAGLGIGSFGPVDLDETSPTWGFVTATPKPHWQDTNLAPFLRDRLGIPVRFDTDVNAAALAEHRWGAGRGLDTIVYLTVGTGIGGGVMANGKLLHGLVHPEVGHFLLPRREDDDFEGFCPFHRSCLEGLAAGPAIERRWGKKGAELGPDHPAWDLEAHYLALALQVFLATYSPQRIVLGGGVMEQSHLFPKIRSKFLTLNNGYIRSASLTPQEIDRYIVPPELGNRAGILGALALAIG